MVSPTLIVIVASSDVGAAPAPGAGLHDKPGTARTHPLKRVVPSQFFVPYGPAWPGKNSEETMTLTRYYPWAQNGRFQDEIKQVFERFFSDDSGDQSNVVTSQWMPRV